MSISKEWKFKQWKFRQRAPILKTTSDKVKGQQTLSKKIDFLLMSLQISGIKVNEIYI